MSEPIKDGGAAFPTYSVMPGYTGKPVKIPVRGMSLRDWFAGQAVGCFFLDKENMVVLMNNAGWPRHDMVASFCYGLADAMLAEREKKQ